jgi:hypothetical protein
VFFLDILFHRMSACFCTPAESRAPELLSVSNIAGNPVTRVLRLREAEIENRFLALPRQRTHGGTDLPLWPCGF